MSNTAIADSISRLADEGLNRQRQHRRLEREKVDVLDQKLRGKIRNAIKSSKEYSREN